MFSGLIETTGEIRKITRGDRSLNLAIIPARTDFPVAQGDSVCVSGVCLTLDKSAGNLLEFKAVYETLSRTTLERITIGERVNLERSLRVGDRVGGHFVLGHVDGTGQIIRDEKKGESILRTFRIGRDLMPFMAARGSVAIDGISLTIAYSDAVEIVVSLIPYTLDKTTLGMKKTGDRVNIECDVLARYLVHYSRYTEAGVMRTDGGRAGESLYEKFERFSA